MVLPSTKKPNPSPLALTPEMLIKLPEISAWAVVAVQVVPVKSALKTV